MRAIFATLLLALAAAALSACGGAEAPKFKLTDVSGAGFGKELNLTDHHGKPRTLADFRGKVVTVFFGFTHCPDACPTTMVEMAQVAKELGPDADKLQVLFVTVDPGRDTQKVLSQYVPSFHPGFLGLYGDAESTARAAKEFKVYFNKKLQRRPLGRHLHPGPSGPAAPVRPVRDGGGGDTPRCPAAASWGPSKKPLSGAFCVRRRARR
jgi:protein SCO1/2